MILVYTFLELVWMLMDGPRRKRSRQCGRGRRSLLRGRKCGMGTRTQVGETVLQCKGGAGRKRMNANGGNYEDLTVGRWGGACRYFCILKRVIFVCHSLCDICLSWWIVRSLPKGRTCCLLYSLMLSSDLARRKCSKNVCWTNTWASCLIWRDIQVKMLWEK